MSCKFRKEELVQEEPDTFLIVSYNQFGKDDINDIETNNYNIQMDANIGQALQNSTKTLTKNLKSLDFKSIRNLKKHDESIWCRIHQLIPNQGFQRRTN